MSKRKRRVFSREFKLSAIQRMIAGESTAELSRELGVPSGHLYRWCAHSGSALGIYGTIRAHLLFLSLRKQVYGSLFSGQVAAAVIRACIARLVD
jgi:hypothetical protein